MPSIMTQPQVQLVKGTGAPAVGWKVYTYQATTTIPKPTYTDFGKVGMNTNPVILDARGMGNIWLDGAYKIVLKDENDVLICTQDNVVSYTGMDFSGIDVDIFDINSTDTSCKPVFADYSLIHSDRGKTITADASAGNIQIFVPAISTVENRWMARVKKVDLTNNTVTLVTNLSEKIDKMDDYTLRSYGDLIEILCDGSSYQITTLYERNHEIQFGTATTINIAQRDQNKCIRADSTTGNCVVNLPTLASVGDGFQVTIVRSENVTTNMVTITPNGTDTIIWPYTICNLKTENELVTLMASGTTWIVINHYDPNPGMIGDSKFSYNNTQPGWILMDDAWTIGSPSAPASYRWNILKDLYLYLWNNFSDAICPVGTGRGATADADWAANKYITLPQIAGRVAVAAGTGTGLTPRAAGDLFGTENVPLTSTNMPAHRHYSADLTGSYPGDWLGYGNDGWSGGGAGAFGPSNLGQAFLTSYVGNSSAISNAQPSIALYAYIKI